MDRKDDFHMNKAFRILGLLVFLYSSRISNSPAFKQ
jgi:hypothetical protein